MMGQFRLVMAVGVLLCAIAPALAETGTIVSSSAEAYPTGTALDDGAIITLEEGESLVVMTATGRGIKLFGPFEGLLPEAEVVEESLIGKLGETVLNPDEGENVIGGLRGPPPQANDEEELPAGKF